MFIDDDDWNAGYDDSDWVEGDSDWWKGNSGGHYSNDSKLRGPFGIKNRLNHFYGNFDIGPQPLSDDEEFNRYKYEVEHALIMINQAYKIVDKRPEFVSKIIRLQTESLIPAREYFGLHYEGEDYFSLANRCLDDLVILNGRIMDASKDI